MRLEVLVSLVGSHFDCGCRHLEMAECCFGLEVLNVFKDDDDLAGRLRPRGDPQLLARG